MTQDTTWSLRSCEEVLCKNSAFAHWIIFAPICLCFKVVIEEFTLNAWEFQDKK